MKRVLRWQRVWLWRMRADSPVPDCPSERVDGWAAMKGERVKEKAMKNVVGVEEWWVTWRV